MSKRVFIAILLVLSTLSGFNATSQEAAPTDHSWETVVDKKSKLAKRLGKYRQVSFNHPEYSFTAHCIVLYPKFRFKAKLVDLPKSGLTHPNVEQIANQNRAILAFNGGFFLPNFSPAGLYIYKGKKTTPLSRQASLSGIISIDRQGGLKILKRKDSLKNSFYAFQAGPYLIDPGGTMGIKSRGKFRRRTVVGETKNKNIFIISTSAVSLYDLAHLLKTKSKDFGIQSVDRALNLDGGPSTALFAKLRHSELVLKEKLSVRNFVVVTNR